MDILKPAINEKYIGLPKENVFVQYNRLFYITLYSAAIGVILLRLPKKIVTFLGNPLGSFIIIFLNLYAYNDFNLTKNVLKKMILSTFIITLFVQIFLYGANILFPEEQTVTLRQMKTYVKDNDEIKNENIIMKIIQYLKQ